MEMQVILNFIMFACSFLIFQNLKKSKDAENLKHMISKHDLKNIHKIRYLGEETMRDTDEDHKV